MGTVTAAARSSVKAAAAAADLLRPRRRGVVVLAYHRVGAGSGLQVDLPASLFEEQVAEIADRAVALDVALAALKHPEPEAQTNTDPVVVTFDDGTADFAEVAFPILERHGVPAVVYVATGYLEEGRDFPAGGRPLSWRALADVVSTGLVEVGSHTHGHALLDRLGRDEVAGELDRSIALVSERVGVVARHFAYPKALAPSPWADAAVRQRFESAALAGTRANWYGATDPYRLARSPVQVADGMRWFRRKVAGGLALEDDARRVLNRRRYSGAST